MPARTPRATKEFAILADASSIISSPNITPRQVLLGGDAIGVEDVEGLVEELLAR